MLDKVRSLFQPEAMPMHAARSAAVLAPTRAPVHGTLRHSNGLQEFLRGWDKAEGRRVLDLGCTSRSNLTYFTERDHSIYSDDLLLECAEARYQVITDAGPGFDAALWLRENLQFSAARFDAILLWDLVDYLPEPLVKPLLERLTSVLRPGGTVLSYFHTRDAGPEAPFVRYHIYDDETLELRPGRSQRLQRIFNNRHVENLFHGYRSVKFFLARDNLREVIAIK
ncbi:MAG: class I SAM-dependent methyltransferase [Terriglobales bacterium]